MDFPDDFESTPRAGKRQHESLKDCAPFADSFEPHMRLQELDGMFPLPPFFGIFLIHQHRRRERVIDFSSPESRWNTSSPHECVHDLRTKETASDLGREPVYAHW